MELKPTILGGLIYAAMLCYGFAALWLALGFRRPGRILFGVGFAAAAGAVAARWVQVGHVPMQNLFEVFLVMGAFSWPLAALARRTWKIGAEGADALLGVVVLLPAGFVFSAEPRQLPPALQTWLFAPHVAAYLLSYIILAKAAVQALACVLGREPAADCGLTAREPAAYRLVCLAFPLLTIGLVLGAVWGKRAWGDWWNWDPKELWALATWLTYVLYLHVRAMTGARRPKLNASIVLLGFALVVITLLWVNLSRLFSGLHSYAR